MNYKNLAILYSAICFVIAAIWMLAPGTLMAAWGVEFNYEAGLVGRRGAALFAGIAVVLFFARHAPASPARTAIVNGISLGCMLLAAMGAYEFFTAHAGLGIMPASIAEVIMALAFVQADRADRAKAGNKAGNKARSKVRNKVGNKTGNRHVTAAAA
jgi:hypothetical protein